MRRRLSAATACAAVAALALPAAASAHGLVGRTDLPIPKWLFGWAAAVVLIASFVALAALWPRPRLQDVGARRLFALPAALDAVCGVIGIAMFAVVVYAGFAGTKSPTANLAPTTIYVIFWVGVPILSAVVGDVFRLFNPWLAVARGVSWLARRAGQSSSAEPIPYPERLGYWPAVAGILGFAWLELVYTNKDDPTVLAALAVAYAVIQFAGMGLFGIEAWSRRGDAFGAYFSLIARISPLHRRDGALWSRPLLGGVTSWPVHPGAVGLVVVLIGTTSFDGFSQGSAWADLAPHLLAFFADLGLGPDAALEATFTAGMAGMVALVGGLYWLGAAGMRSTVGGDARVVGLARDFAHTLAPIALAYVVAHYFSLLLYQGQAMAYLVSDPLGHGSDLFGTADRAIDYTVIGATGIWYVQVAALVSGHVAGLVLAHDRAVARFSDPRVATRSQYWMLTVMVGFTSLGLWLLSSTG